VTVQGFGFANSNFLNFAISLSTDIVPFITYSRSLRIIDDFSLQLTAFERVSLLHCLSWRSSP
jgi:hypothetical protein